MDRQDETDFLFARDALHAGKAAEALSIFQRLVNENTGVKGDAAYALGLAYAYAIGVSKDEAKAVGYFRIAEEADYELATYQQAIIHHNHGEFQEALIKYKHVAATNPSAAFRVCAILMHHKELRQQEGEAERYLALALEQGHLLAKKVEIVDRIKGRKGITQIPGGIRDWICLVLEIRKAVLRKNELIFQ